MTFDTARLHFGWRAMLDFTRHLPLDSATRRELDPESARFASPLSQSAMLADIIDLTNYTRHLVARANFKGVSSRPPNPYPRPGVQDKNTQHFGSGAIPISQFDEWYYGGDN